MRRHPLDACAGCARLGLPAVHIALLRQRPERDEAWEGLSVVLAIVGHLGIGALMRPVVPTLARQSKLLLSGL